MSEAKETPIRDLLSNVPSDARQMYDYDDHHSMSIPFGVLSAKAVAEIDRLRAELAAVKHKLFLEEECNEIIHNHFDCPVCEVKGAGTSIYGEPWDAKGFYCESCRATFIRKPEGWELAAGRGEGTK